MIYFTVLSAVSFLLAIVLLVAVGGFIVWAKSQIEDEPRLCPHNDDWDQCPDCRH